MRSSTNIYTTSDAYSGFLMPRFRSNFSHEHFLLQRILRLSKRYTTQSVQHAPTPTRMDHSTPQGGCRMTIDDVYGSGDLFTN